MDELDSIAWKNIVDKGCVSYIATIIGEAAIRYYLSLSIDGVDVFRDRRTISVDDPEWWNLRWQGLFATFLLLYFWTKLLLPSSIVSSFTPPRRRMIASRNRTAWSCTGSESLPMTDFEKDYVVERMVQLSRSPRSKERRRQGRRVRRWSPLRWGGQTREVAGQRLRALLTFLSL